MTARFGTLAAHVIADDVATNTARQIASLLTGAGVHDLAAAADAEVSRLCAGICTLAVVGEFKRGKSTLINALVEADMLPVGALPLTALGTRAEFGESVRAVVEFLDGRHVEIQPTEIAEYASERGNPGNQRQVCSVTVTTPARLLRHGLRLVDTPGIGSVFADVSETACALLDQADAALVVLSAEQPASRRELDFLNRVIGSGIPTFVVENKIDLVPPPEHDDVVEFVRGQIRDVAGDRVCLFALSAEHARRAQRAGDSGALQASGLPALRDALGAFALRECVAAVEQGARRRLIRLVDQAVARLDVKQRGAPIIQRWRADRRVQRGLRVNVVLSRELFEASQRVAAAAAEIESRLAGLGLSTAFEQMDAALDCPVSVRKVRSARDSAVRLEAAVHLTLDGLINRWSAAERTALSEATAELAARWRARAVELLSPIIGRVEPPVPAAIECPPPLVALPPMHVARPLLLPGRFGRLQARRRARHWVRDTLPAMLNARRAAVTANITAAIRKADTQFHRQLVAWAEQCAAEPPMAAPIPATDEMVTSQLRVLRTALMRENENGARA